MNAHTAALAMLARRELSVQQLRDRLARRSFAPDEIDRALERLIADRTVDDRRVAIAYARMEASIKGRGKRRVLQAIRRLGISQDVTDEAVAAVYDELDEDALFQHALERRLKGATVRDLDEKARSRIVRQLVGQGFELSRIMRALRR